MLTIVDYNAGNLRSVQRACHAAGVPSSFTQDPDLVAQADRIIFPGVGHAKAAMETVRHLGMDQALQAAFARGVPILGVCVGAQLMLDSSEEGDTAAMGLLPGKTERFRLDDPELKIPHMGWNTVRVERPHPLLVDVEPGDAFYFVHSYFLAPETPEHCYASSDYGGRFCCAIGRDNLFATQFHPEKSGRIGLRILERFARWEGQPC